MIYTIDNIPAKVFFAIKSSGNIDLLSIEPIENDLIDNWLKILEHDELNQANKGVDKFLKLSVKINHLELKYRAIINAVSQLEHSRDKELEEFLKENNFKLNNETFDQDLEKVKSDVNSIKIRISRFQVQLDKINSAQKQDSSFEDLFMSYLTFLEFGFKDANTITLLEFRGLEKQVLSKVKALENNGQ